MKISYLISFVFLCLITTPKDKESKSDLVVLKIETPEWQHDERRTKVKVTIQNNGKGNSLPCRAMLYDLDLSVEQGNTLGLKKLYIELLAENNNRAEYWKENENYHIDANLFDYDEDFAVFLAIPELKSRQELELTFFIKDIWVYNSNCELRVILDVDQTNNDPNKKNNQMDFFDWG